MLGLRPIIKMMLPGNHSLQVNSPWVFTLLWGEWHPTREEGSTVVINKDSASEIELAPETGEPLVEIVMEREGGLRGDPSPSQNPRLFFPLPVGLKNVVLAGLRRGFGFTPEQLRRYTPPVPQPREPVPPPKYGALYCFIGDMDDRGTPELEVITASEPWRKIRAGWAIFRPPDAIMTEPGDGEISLPPERCIILNGRYGALSGPGRELHFEHGASPLFRNEILSDFDFLPAEAGPDSKIVVTKTGKDALLEIV
jgi:hypothetical protein